MNITILDKSRIKHNNRYLQEFQTYNDIDDETAQRLVASGLAKAVDPSIASVSYLTASESEHTPKFDPKKNGGYVAEAVIDPAKKAKLESEGKLNDPLPVVGKDSTQPKDNTPEPEVKTEVEDATGKKLSDEELKQKEDQTVAGAGKQASETTPTVGELQSSGEEVK